MGDKEEKKRTQNLNPIRLSDGEQEISEFEITEFDPHLYETLKEFYDKDLKLWVKSLDYKDHLFSVDTIDAHYSYDEDKETLIKDCRGKREELGCGAIEVKAFYKKATKTLPARILLDVQLTPDYEKDFEIVPFHRDEEENQKAIETFMKKFIFKPYSLLDNVIGIEINFNKVFYEPEELRKVQDILLEIDEISKRLKFFEGNLSL